MSAIISGFLHTDASMRTDKKGNPYVVLTIRERHGEGTRWWRCIFFGEHDGPLRQGNPIAVSGEFDASVYTPPDGSEPKISWTFKVAAILTTREQRGAPR